MGIPEGKTCPKCGLSKQRSDFYNRTSAKDGKHSYCKVCSSVYKQTVTYREKQKKYARAYNKTPERLAYVKEYNVRNSLKLNYQLSLEEYNEMFNLQEGKCAGCYRHQTELPKRLAVDHCHLTGKIRGLLCSRCNLALGMLRDDLKILENLQRYLLEPTLKLVIK